MNPKTDWFFEKETKWKEAYSELRILVLDCGITEELKWGCPSYTVGKSYSKFTLSLKYDRINFYKINFDSTQTGVEAKIFCQYDRLIWISSQG